MLLENNGALPLDFLISESILGNRKMQGILYRHFATNMYYVCLRYSDNTDDAQDILQEGFIKVFKKLNTYRGEGSFEGWVRRIITRTALIHLRDNKKNQQNTGLCITLKDKEINILDKLAEKDIISIVTKLPPGYRKIFTMHVLEGYNHREIADILGCSINTSKSQFSRSRTYIQKLIKNRA